MEKSIKHLFIRTVVSFSLLALIWLSIALLLEVGSIYSTPLFIVSLFPCAFYIVYGTKLLNALEVDKFYRKL